MTIPRLRYFYGAEHTDLKVFRKEQLKQLG